MDFLKNIFGGGPSVDIAAELEKGAIIIDVRSPGEFKQGHAEGSINIPLNQISAKMETIRKKNRVVIACCASGMRSKMAAKQLNQAGIEAYNGGSWGKVQAKL